MLVSDFPVCAEAIFQSRFTEIGTLKLIRETSSGVASVVGAFARL